MQFRVQGIDVYWLIDEKVFFTKIVGRLNNEGRWNDDPKISHVVHKGVEGYCLRILVRFQNPKKSARNLRFSDHSRVGG